MISHLCTILAYILIGEFTKSLYLLLSKNIFINNTSTFLAIWDGHFFDLLKFKQGAKEKIEQLYEQKTLPLCLRTLSKLEQQLDRILLIFLIIPQQRTGIQLVHQNYYSSHLIDDQITHEPPSNSVLCSHSFFHFSYTPLFLPYLRYGAV